MKKLLVILIISLISITIANSTKLDGFQNINSLLEQGYELHSTNLIQSGQYLYNLISDGSNGKHRLMTCVYFIEQEVTICSVP
jgi:hypothetical protein